MAENQTIEQLQARLESQRAHIAQLQKEFEQLQQQIKEINHLRNPQTPKAAKRS
jgi:peptidoglycan hydrolase CwlO-like protein